MTHLYGCSDNPFTSKFPFVARPFHCRLRLPISDKNRYYIRLVVFEPNTVEKEGDSVRFIESRDVSLRDHWISGIREHNSK
ncbi:hypothetical protein Csa_015496, partial [Cucumis sativus]